MLKWHGQCIQINYVTSEFSSFLVGSSLKLKCNARTVHVYIYKKERQIKALSVLCPFLFLTFFAGAGCSRLASLIEVIGRGLIEVSLYPLISPACKDSFLCRLWFGVISVAGTCEALLLYLRFVCWIPDCYLSLIFLCLIFFVFQVSSRCQSR